MGNKLAALIYSSCARKQESKFEIIWIPALAPTIVIEQIKALLIARCLKDAFYALRYLVNTFVNIVGYATHTAWI